VCARGGGGGGGGVFSPAAARPHCTAGGGRRPRPAARPREPSPGRARPARPGAATGPARLARPGGRTTVTDRQVGYAGMCVYATTHEGAIRRGCRLPDLAVAAAGGGGEPGGAPEDACTTGLRRRTCRPGAARAGTAGKEGWGVRRRERMCACIYTPGPLAPTRTASHPLTPRRRPPPCALPQHALPAAAADGVDVVNGS